MTSKHSRIAIILPVGSEFSDRLTEGIIEGASRDSRIILLEYPYQDGDKDPLRNRKRDFDGALVWLDRRDVWAEALLAAGVKVVNANRCWQGRIPSAAFDGAAIARLAAEHLFALNRAHAAFVGWETAQDPHGSTPLTWFADCCREAGVIFHSHTMSHLRGIDGPTQRLPVSAYSRLRGFLDALPRPAAIWCQDDYLARMVCDMAAELGIHVPGNIAVLGTGDLRVAMMGSIAVSTIPLPAQNVGREMLRMVVQLIDGVPLSADPTMIPPPSVTVRASSAPGDSGGEAAFHHARAWIRDHASEGITVNELMEMVPMSQRAFSQKFAALFGRTPGGEIRHVRMELAKSYLVGTQYSIERISRLCGYDQQAKFSNFFKREAGVTPSKYRDIHQQAPGTQDLDSKPD